ncbi:hypothetical protein JTB14_002078 [Gonioctena quinquepunctata]|nr:hypothetical protein JTB14_002078 [Gonioctena quinquepunctata]
MTQDSGGKDPPDKDNTNTSPVINQGNSHQLLYSYTNPGPYEVYIQTQKDNTDGTSNIGNLHQLSVAKMIYNLKIGELKKLKRKGLNRMSVEFKTFSAANSFLNSEIIKSKGLECFIPGNNITCKGIIRYMDEDVTEKEIIDNTNTKLVNCKVINARRLNRKKTVEGVTTYVPSSTVCLTFSGKKLPTEIEIYSLYTPVEEYRLPVIQCYQCLLYGHTKKQCRSKSICQNCAKIHDTTVQCPNPTKCRHCQSVEHQSVSKQCPEFERQNRIRHYMTYDHLSFYDASERVPKPKKPERYNYRTTDFPNINNNPSLQNRQIRLNEYNNNPNYVSYSQKTKQDNEIRKRRADSPPGYDIRAHNECLYSYPKSPGKDNTPIYDSPRYQPGPSRNPHLPRQSHSSKNPIIEIQSHLNDNPTIEMPDSFNILLEYLTNMNQQDKEKYITILINTLANKDAESMEEY